MSNEETIIRFDNTESEEHTLPIVAPSELEETTYPSILDLFKPQELRADNLNASDYCNTPIFIHDFFITQIKVNRDGITQNVDMVIMSVTIPEAQEYGLMNASAWSVVRNFKFIEKSGKFQPFWLEFVEKESGLGKATYHIKID